MEKLQYLNKYTMQQNGYVKLMTEEAGSISCIPELWKTAFKETDIQKRITILLNNWEMHLKEELRNTVSFLKECLENIELIEINYRYSMLYTLKNREGKVLYYEGRNPNEQVNNPALEDLWDRIPLSIRTFYKEIHNGFYYFASGAMGLVPLEAVACLGDEDFDWAILEELDSPLKIDLNSSFGFFTNGMGAYAAIDTNNNTAALWSADEEPEYNINFWDLADEWYVIGFDS